MTRESAGWAEQLANLASTRTALAVTIVGRGRPAAQAPLARRHRPLARLPGHPGRRAAHEADHRAPAPRGERARSPRRRASASRARTPPPASPSTPRSRSSSSARRATATAASRSPAWRPRSSSPSASAACYSARTTRPTCSPAGPSARWSRRCAGSPRTGSRFRGCPSAPPASRHTQRGERRPTRARPGTRRRSPAVLGVGDALDLPRLAGADEEVRRGREVARPPPRARPCRGPRSAPRASSTVLHARSRSRLNSSR